MSVEVTMMLSNSGVDQLLSMNSFTILPSLTLWIRLSYTKCLHNNILHLFLLHTLPWRTGLFSRPFSPSGAGLFSLKAFKQHKLVVGTIHGQCLADAGIELEQACS